jgi:haloacid dehalogenase superfamily, subfamily IA, variant 1 with third motif having Dx(3-4)D or Dx(3-4)E
MEKFKGNYPLGVLLDLDNTLYNYHRAHDAARLAVIIYIAKKFKHTREVVSQAFDQAREEVQARLAPTAASHNRLLYFQRMLEKLSLNAVQESLSCYNLYWDIFLQNMFIFPGVEEFLERVSKQSSICLVTDLTAHIQHRKIEQLGLAEYVHFIVTSEEVGCDKPQQAIFLAALKKMNLDAKNVCMIGDNFHKDIIGALRLGIKSFWLTEARYNVTPLIVPFTSFKELIGHFYE